jgi:hypothetical protein
MNTPARLTLLLALVLPTTAAATTLSLRSEETIEDGVVLQTYRASSPSTDIRVLRVDLCADGVYFDATRASDSTQSTGSWADEVDATAATNGDFYKTGPLRVYGDAVGGGVRWPTDQTGLDSAYASEWYYEHAGWIAFVHDGIEFSHTGYVKEHTSGLAEGWENSDLRPDPPADTIALVSGFPELVIEGKRVTCSDPEADSCFPDRSDMRDRNPRTAMGFTEDRGTLLLVVADGRTSSNAGLYGSELADILEQLGAWEAFNLDGGGSSQLWTTDDGYVNDLDGNNNGSGTRSVANHWGVFAGGRDWLPSRPGHCESAPSCGTISAAGGEIDDSSGCFRTFGPREYWREESDGRGGHLYWTNAYQASSPDNWAWWRTEMAEAGTYEVSVWADATWSVFDSVEYEIVAGGTSKTVRVDPSGTDGWVTLGTYDFAAGGDQWVAMYDDQSSNPGSNKHIIADALRLTRTGTWCGDGTCDPGETCGCADCPVETEIPDNGTDDDCDGAIDEGGQDSAADSNDSSADTADTDSDSNPSGAPDLPGEMKSGTAGCGCAAGSAPVSGIALVLGIAMSRRRKLSAPA